MILLVQQRRLWRLSAVHTAEAAVSRQEHVFLGGFQRSSQLRAVPPGRSAAPVTGVQVAHLTPHGPRKALSRAQG